MTMARAKTKKGVHEPSPVLVIEPPFEELIATVEMCKVKGKKLTLVTTVRARL